MKKFLLFTLFFALIFATCDDKSNDNSNDNNSDNTNNNADVIGMWTGNYGTGNKGEIKLDINNGSWVLDGWTLDVDGSWILIFKDTADSMTTYSGWWTRNGNTLILEREQYGLYYTATASLSGDKLILDQSWSTINGRPKTSELSKSGDSGIGDTTLKIKNQSFTEITDVIWNNVIFSNNQYENSIKTGTDVTSNVEAGSGYIFFKRKSNPITARTRDLIIVENNQKVEFTFTDNTVIVEVNNPNNNGTLGSVQSTVVWWDDAEGEMQPYHLKQSDVGYYSGSGSGSSITSGFLGNGRYYYFAPKNGDKSIRVGGTNTSLQHLKINLSKRAKLSFWYANKYGRSSSTIFSINGVEKAKWTTNIDWSFVTFDLEPGINDIIWEKKDGYHYDTTYEYYYLSLDDILIYYTE